MNINDYDASVQTWIREIVENSVSSPDKTLKFCNDLIEYANEKQDVTLLGFGYFYCGLVYYCLNDGKNFYDSLNMAVRFLDQGGEYDLMARCYNFLGIKASNGGNIPLALEYYTNGVKYANMHNLKEQEALMNINLGGLFHRSARYQEAQRYYKQAMEYFQSLPMDESVHTFLLALECNRVKTFVALGYFQLAEEAIAGIREKHWDYVTQIERNIVHCAEAILYHEEGDSEKRNQCAHQISAEISPKMAILDYFDDYYDYAKMLLSTDLADDFWKVVDTIEPLVKDAGSTDLMLKIISLKIHYYRKTGRNAEYLQATGLYYELSELMEVETREMVNNVINLRQSLEAANQLRIQVEKQNQILVEKSEMDPLTKLANRFRLNDYAEEAFQEALSRQSTIAFFIMDVDYFKEFNDNYGHQQGDQCLIEVADSLRAIAEAHHGFAARYGGDEFVLMFTNVTFEETAGYARELREHILNKNIAHEFSKAIPQVSLSQGVCYGIPKRNSRVWDYLRKADENLYAIKQVGRNNFCVTDLSDERKVTGE